MKNSEGINEIMQKDNVFEYGGRHFLPVRKFNAKDGDFIKITKHLRVDKELGFSAADYYGTQKFDYSYDGFYNALGNKNYDVFKCMENGKLYIPCMHELQRYEPEQSKNYER